MCRKMRHFMWVLLLWLSRAEGYSDLYALAQFKKGIQTDPQGHLVGSWDTSKVPAPSGCPVNWYGVQCSDGHVVSITLSGMNLVGSLNFSALVGMQMLKNLSVSNNQLSGALPSDMGSLRSLEFLDLSQNSFSGMIPSELMKVDSLVYLNLSLNKFEGSVPAPITSLKQLKYLDLHANGFSGDLGFLDGLQNAAFVDLSSNMFSGSLTSLSENSTFAGLVQYINVSSNKLSGQLFERMPLFDNLEVFDASGNQLSGQIPFFHFVVSLRILRLQSNNFSGSLPGPLLKESSMVLQELDLSSNQLQGPMGTVTSTTLKYLNLSTNKLDGQLPLRIGSCSTLDLSYNRFSGNLSSIRSWGNLVEVIDLSSNLLTGTLPNDTSSFLRLNSLKVSNNLLDGELPLVIGTYPALSVIDFSNNHLHGLLPPSLFASFRLSDLNLSRNSFTGAIPLRDSMRDISPSSLVPLFVQNSSLYSLDLSGNSIDGSLPRGIGSLNALKVLNLGNNNISGQIPEEIGSLSGLLYLDLTNNFLDGVIPGNLPNALISFNVSNNNLSGVVPDNLMKFPESSFHPGNSLLIYPPGHGASGSRNLGAHAHRVKTLLRDLLIVGFVGIAVLVIIMSILVYNRTTTRDTRKANRNRQMPHSDSSRNQKMTGPTAFQDTLSSVSAMVPEHRNNLPSTGESTVYGGILSTATSEKLTNSVTISSPKNGEKLAKSIFSDPSGSTDCNSFDPTTILKVYSPDKLAGDLHLFDQSYIFTAEDLSHAPAEIIGRSCHGTSYKATLDTQHVVTVKWLREGISKGKKEFSREAKKLGSIKHPSIVSLKGYYWGPKEHERLIIAEYINAVSLTTHLCEWEQRKLAPLSLTQRLSIAVDIASSLDYLHNERAIPHGNLKSSNVILQFPDMNALLTDYSLHRIMNPAGMAEQVLNAGALGYRPPEFVHTSKPCPSVKSDVYAFGVILLELVTGKGAGEIASSNPGVVDLTDWVRLLANENRSFECFDMLIPGVDSTDTPPKVLEDMLGVALRCIRSAAERPEIRTVFEDLSALAGLTVVP